MTKQQYINLILSEMKGTRLAKESAISIDYDKAMENHNFKELEISRCELELVLAEKTYYQEDCSSEKKEHNAILAKCRAIALDLGLNPYDIDCSCPLCQDAGRIEGKLCKCVEKKLKAIIQEANQDINIPNFKFSDHNINKFLDKTHSRIINSLYKVLFNYSGSFPTNEKPNILLTGKTAVGKTFALSALGNEIEAKGYSVLFILAQELNELFRKISFGQAKPEEYIYLDNLQNCDLLIIDDLGSEPVYRTVTKEHLYSLISTRATRRKPYCITTNLTLQELNDRYDTRIFSRILDKSSTSIFNIEGVDLRLGINSKN